LCVCEREKGKKETAVNCNREKGVGGRVVCMCA